MATATIDGYFHRDFWICSKILVFFFVGLGQGHCRTWSRVVSATVWVALGGISGNVQILYDMIAVWHNISGWSMIRFVQNGKYMGGRHHLWQALEEDVHGHSCVSSPLEQTAQQVSNEPIDKPHCTLEILFCFIYFHLKCYLTLNPNPCSSSL